MTYATVMDVATRLGRPITDPGEQAQVQAWLEDAEAVILSSIPTLADLVAAGTPTVATLVMVESNAVIRKMRNPEGYTSETIDDYTYRYNEQVRRGDIFLTDDEWGLLLPAGSTGGAFSTRPTFTPDVEAGAPVGIFTVGDPYAGWSR